LGYTLLPRLRGAASVAERRRLVRREAQLAGGATLLASAAIWWIAPFVVTRFLAGKYTLTTPLLLAAVAAGAAKVASAFATSAATALCTERELAPHPSLKPQAFLRQLVRAVLPLGKGIILDPFAGAGSTLAAAEAVGYASVGVEKDADYFDMACKAIPRLARIRLTSEDQPL
jgi:DNA modification methylase